MKWTKQTPTKEGWYWHRNLGENYSERRVVELYSHCDDGILIAYPDDGIEVEDTENEWSGPIPEPGEEVEK